MKNYVKAKVRIAWKAWKDREDPERPEEFTREEAAKNELQAIYEKLWTQLYCLTGENPEEGCNIDEVVNWNEPFPLKEWDCASFPMTGWLLHGPHGVWLNHLPSVERLSEFCKEGRRWLGIEVEFADKDVRSKHAEIYAPDGEVLFKDDCDGEFPSFFNAVEEYWPVYAIKMAAESLE